MTREHMIEVAKYLNKLIKEENYNVIGKVKVGGMRVRDYTISVNHEQKQIILRDKEYWLDGPAFMQFGKYTGE